jgi:hypothetical protein
MTDPSEGRIPWSSIIAATAGLLGAIIGGFTTYLTQSHAEETAQAQAREHRLQSQYTTYAAAATATQTYWAAPGSCTAFALFPDRVGRALVYISIKATKLEETSGARYVHPHLLKGLAKRIVDRYVEGYFRSPPQGALVKELLAYSELKVADPPANVLAAAAKLHKGLQAFGPNCLGGANSATGWTLKKGLDLTTRWIEDFSAAARASRSQTRARPSLRSVHAHATGVHGLDARWRRLTARSTRTGEPDGGPSKTNASLGPLTF